MVNLLLRLLGKKDDSIAAEVDLEGRIPASGPAEGSAVAQFKESLQKKGTVEGQASTQRDSNLEIASKEGTLGRGRIN